MVGFGLQTVATLLVGLLYANTVDRQALESSVLSGSSALIALVPYLSAGISLWLVLWVVFNQRKRVRLEILETENLKREREAAGGGGAIFDVDDAELMVARRRLRWMYRWMLPGYTLILALMLVWAGSRAPWSFGLGLTDESWPVVANANVTMWFLGGLTLVLFLFSRYATGLARLPEWRMLRAGASFTLGNTLMMFLGVVALGAQSTSAVPEHLLAYIIRMLILALSAELVLNFVLDLYRPRTVGEDPRPAFESRLLGLLSEPGAIAHSVAEAVNYQFGFEVSSTWFYQLMQRAIVPLVCFGVVVLIALSTVVVVQPHERAVVERWGHPTKIADGDGDFDIETLGPDIHFKLPWPVDRVYHHPVTQVQEVVLGMHAGEAEDDGHGHENEGRPRLVLWTEAQHFDGEGEHFNLLVAADSSAPGRTSTTTQPGDDADSGRAVPVSIIQAVVPIHFTISHLGKFAYRYADGKAVLESVAYRELIRLASSMSLQEIMGSRRGEATRVLRERIEKRIGPDGLDLGVTIKFVGLDGLHPPQEVAASFQAVVGARIESETMRLAARALAINTKIAVAGGVELADALYDAIGHAQDLRGKDVEPGEVDAVEHRIRQLMFGDMPGQLAVGGAAAKSILDAQAERWRSEADARADVERFMREQPGYEAAPQLYCMRRYLGVMSQAFAGVKKYIVAVKTDPVRIIWRENGQAGTALDWTATGDEAGTQP